MSRFKDVRLPPLQGLNEDLNPNALRPGELVRADNCYRRGSAMGTRPGIEREPTSQPYDAAITGTPAVGGLVEYRYGIDANRFLVAVGGGKIWKNDSADVTGAVTVTAGQNNLWTFAQHKDTLYAAGGANNDNIWKWTGTGNASAVTFQNSGASSIDAKFIFQKFNYGFLAGMDGTAAEDNAMIVRYSDLNNMDSWPVGNTIGGTSAIGGFSSYGDEFLTGFGEFTDNNGDWLLCLSNKRIYSVLYQGNPIAPFYVDSVIENGCVHQNCFVSLGTDSGEAIYLSRRGVHSLRQSQQHGQQSDSFLSWKIRETFNGLNMTRLKYASGAYWETEGIVLFLVSTGSNTAHDLILCLDVKEVQNLSADTARWTIWRLSMPSGEKANFLCSAREADSIGGSPFVYIGGTAGSVCRFSTDVFSDLGQPFQTAIQTKHETFGANGITKGIGDVYVEIQPGGDYKPKMQTIFDFGRRVSESHDLVMEYGGAVYGSAHYGADTYDLNSRTSRVRIYETGEGDSISFSFGHSGANEPFWIAGVSAQVRTFGEAAGDLAE